MSLSDDERRAEGIMESIQAAHDAIQGVNPTDHPDDGVTSLAVLYAATQGGVHAAGRPDVNPYVFRGLNPKYFSM